MQFETENKRKKEVIIKIIQRERERKSQILVNGL